MNPVTRQGAYRSYLKRELSSSAAYEAMARIERDPVRSDAFRRLAQAELRHAQLWADKLGVDPSDLAAERGGVKVRLVALAARLLGTRRVAQHLVRRKRVHADAYSADQETQHLAAEEREQGMALRRLASRSDEPDGPTVMRSGLASGNLRAAVLGVNDGLVSNFSLVMGVAGGISDPDIVLLAGVAGLLAGAFSMAAGEYVSVRSQRDVFEHQIERERYEIAMWPDEEEKELVTIYRSKGLSQDEAETVARRLCADPEAMLDTMVREELGLNPDELGSPVGASLSSFTAFVMGAVIPIIPYIFGTTSANIPASAALSASALLLVGGILAKSSNRNPLWGAARMALAGGVAASVTFGIGRLVGMSLAG